MKSILKSSVKNIIFPHIIGLFILVGLVALVTIVVLNLTFTYPWISRHFQLDVRTGLDHATLFYNYRRLIHYNNWPWITTLYLPDFVMSDTGEFHFWEVKVIFQVLQIFTILFLAWLFVSFRRKWQLLKYFNASANLTFIIFGIILAIMLIDFNFFFYWFHRALFNNDYWIFNPQTDPVIRALPAELFMIKGFIMIVLLFLISLVMKTMFYWRKYRGRNRSSL